MLKENYRLIASSKNTYSSLGLIDNDLPNTQFVEVLHKSFTPSKIVEIKS